MRVKDLIFKSLVWCSNRLVLGLQTPTFPLIGDDVAYANTLESCPANAYRVYINRIHTHKRAMKKGRREKGEDTRGGRNERQRLSVQQKFGWRIEYKYVQIRNCGACVSSDSESKSSMSPTINLM
jgi:hypothetical protein